MQDKEVMEAYLDASDLNWTSVRLPNIVNKDPKNTIKESFDGRGISFSITAQDVAEFMVCIESAEKYFQKAVSISN